LRTPRPPALSEGASCVPKQNLLTVLPTVGFTIFPYRSPGTYSPVCSSIITIVGGLSPKFHVTSIFFHFFLANRSLAIDFYEHRHHGCRWPWPLYRRPWLEDARSGATHAITTSWATTAGGKNTVLLPGRFAGFSSRHTNQTARASTAAHGRKTPVHAQRTRSPHHGRRRLSSVFCDSSWEGKKYSTSSRAI
jgi:hypothetical protein